MTKESISSMLTSKPSLSEIIFTLPSLYATSDTWKKIFEGPFKCAFFENINNEIVSIQ